MKRFTVCICLDDAGGMTFLGKRQSRDRVLLSDMFSSFSEKIYVTPFSVPILTSHEDKYIVVDNPFNLAPDGAVIFDENIGLAPYLDDIDTIVLYKWNRRYPSDKRIDISFDEWRTVTKTEFEGSSHEKITKLVMKRRKV